LEVDSGAFTAGLVIETELGEKELGHKDFESRRERLEEEVYHRWYTDRERVNLLLKLKLTQLQRLRKGKM